MVTPAFSSEDFDVTETDYRRISPAAMLALLLGLASPLAFLSTLLWALPLGAVVAGAVAIAQTARDESVFAGQRLAQLGLFLGVAFGLGAALHWWTERRCMTLEAEQMLATWFDQLQNGQLPQAFELTKSHLARRPPETDLDDYYQQADNHKKLQTFRDRVPVPQLLKLGKNARPVLQGIHDLDSDEMSEKVLLDYRVYNGKDLNATPLQMTFECLRAKQNVPLARRWSIGNIFTSLSE